MRDSAPGAADREGARAHRARDVSSIANVSKTADPAGRRAGARGHGRDQARPKLELRGGAHAIRAGTSPSEPGGRGDWTRDSASLVEPIAHELEHVLEQLDDVNLTQLAQGPGVTQAATSTIL